MKKLVIFLIIVLVIVMLLLVGGGLYVYFTLKSFLISPSSDSANQATSTNQVSGDKNPLLTPSQESTLEKIGIDPSKLPSEITPAMEDCFTAKLGADRVAAIKAGASPSLIDFAKAKSCL
ncbi:MAG: hypothetical protein Q7K65_02245 [Candidatus Buchananbacteria bacterium]|nr:hypothetical protein [Candidatus Buchananbacteria bacterium]